MKTGYGNLIRKRMICFPPAGLPAGAALHLAPIRRRKSSQRPLPPWTITRCRKRAALPLGRGGRMALFPLRSHPVAHHRPGRQRRLSDGGQTDGLSALSLLPTTITIRPRGFAQPCTPNAWFNRGILVTCRDAAVIPALVLDLDSDVYEYAGIYTVGGQ